MQRKGINAHSHKYYSTLTDTIIFTFTHRMLIFEKKAHFRAQNKQFLWADLVEIGKRH